jgi:hypothetical protein
MSSTPTTTTATPSTAVERGQTWACNEADAEDGTVPEPHDVPLWEPQPRFRAVVDHVDGSYVELTATSGNDHPRTPAFGASIATTTTALRDKPRWSLVGDSK